mgnify:CR=1 FL=1|jgi:hypothetical protein
MMNNNYNYLEYDVFYKIIDFTDGYENYINCSNYWYSYAYDRDNLSLVNAYDFNIYISSIKIWKTKIFLIE